MQNQIVFNRQKANLVTDGTDGILQIAFNIEIVIESCGSVIHFNVPTCV